MDNDQSSTNQPQTQAQIPAQVQADLDDLTQQAKQLEEEVKQTGADANRQLDEIDVQVSQAEARVKAATERMDTADKAASDELDDIILEEAQDSTKELG